MRLRDLSRAEAVGVLGGALLAVGLFLAWYEIGRRNAIGTYRGPATLTGWQALAVLRWLLLAAAAAPLILVYIIARGRTLSWPRGEMTAVIAMVALGLVLYRLFISKPGTVTSLTSLRLGGLVSLLGALLMLGGSALRASASERPRKPPGVL